MTTTEIIQELDAKYEALLFNNGQLKTEDLRSELFEAYIHHHHYLRRAVLAGEALAKAVREITFHNDNGYWDYSEVYDSIVSNRDAALSAYRTAIEEKNV